MLAILLGGGMGLLLMGRVSDKVAKSMLRAIGLCICVIGISGALGGDIMLLVVSIAGGAFIGELLRIDDGLNYIGTWAQTKMGKGEGSKFSEGFVTATLLFCVGAMAVVGSIDSGLRDDQSIIFTKSLIDAVSALLLASTLGLGVLFSAIPILLYQGSIELFAGALQHVFTLELVSQIGAVGGVMILGIGVNMVADAKIKVANLLPGFLIAVAYYYFILH
ncbi:MAG: DUF554 domain-containing protein [Oscillospiraceae bacterium]|nr:DUF554 domain-containing protein [Oscillospiraceae bacterium]